VADMVLVLCILRTAYSYAGYRFRLRPDRSAAAGAAQPIQFQFRSSRACFTASLIWVYQREESELG